MPRVILPTILQRSFLFSFSPCEERLSSETSYDRPKVMWVVGQAGGSLDLSSNKLLTSPSPLVERPH